MFKLFIRCWGSGRVRVKDFMTKEPVTFFEEEALSEIMLLFDPRAFRHLPIVDASSKLVGIVSHRDLYNVHLLTESDDSMSGVAETFNQKIRQKTIKELMTTNIITIEPNGYLTDAAKLMVTNNINSLPVLKNNNLVGILTSTDIMRAYAGE